MTDHPPDRVRLPWVNGAKMLAMEKWAQNLMRDDDLSRGAIRVAWALQFAFHSKEGNKRGACWETKETLAARAGMTAKAVQGGLAELDKAGHIIRTEQTIGGKEMRVIYPCFNQSVQDRPKRAARGGLPKGVSGKARAAEKRSARGSEVETPRGSEGQYAGGSEVHTPCIPEPNPGENPFQVQGVRIRARAVLLDDDLNF